MAKFHLHFPPGCWGQRGDAAARLGMEGGHITARRRALGFPLCATEVKHKKRSISSPFYPVAQKVWSLQHPSCPADPLCPAHPCCGVVPPGMALQWDCK